MASPADRQPPSMYSDFPEVVPDQGAPEVYYYANAPKPPPSDYYPSPHMTTPPEHGMGMSPGTPTVGMSSPGTVHTGMYSEPPSGPPPAWSAAAATTTAPPTKPRKFRLAIIIAIVAVLLLAIGLGVGLGVGLSNRGGNASADGQTDGGNNNNNNNNNNDPSGDGSSTNTGISGSSALAAVSFLGPSGDTQRIVFYQDAVSNGLHLSIYTPGNSSWTHTNITERLLTSDATESQVVAQPGTRLEAVVRYISSSSTYDDGNPAFVLILYYVAASDGTIVQAECSDLAVQGWTLGPVTSMGIKPVEGSTFAAHYDTVFGLKTMADSLFVQTQDTPGKVNRFANGPNGTDVNKWTDTGAVMDVQQTQVGGRGALLSVVTFVADIRIYFTDQARVLEMWPSTPLEVPWYGSTGGGTSSDEHLRDNLSDSLAAISFVGAGNRQNVVLARHGTDGQGIAITWHDGEWREAQDNPTFAAGANMALPKAVSGDANGSTALAFSADLSAYVVVPSDDDKNVMRLLRFDMDKADPRAWKLAEEIPSGLS